MSQILRFVVATGADGEGTEGQEMEGEGCRCDIAASNFRRAPMVCRPISARRASVGAAARISDRDLKPASHSAGAYLCRLMARRETASGGSVARRGAEVREGGGEGGGETGGDGISSGL